MGVLLNNRQTFLKLGDSSFYVCSQSVQIHPGELRCSRPIEIMLMRCATLPSTIRRTVLARQLPRCFSESQTEKSLSRAEGAFVDNAFKIFDHNNDQVIELYEVEKAYAHDGAAAEMIRLLDVHGLSTQPISASTIATFDLMQAVKRRDCGTWDGGGVITPEMFEKWLLAAVKRHNKE